MNAPLDLPPSLPSQPLRTPKLNAALAKAQGAIDLAKKDSLNPHFGSKFADLAACREVARKPLADNELAVLQEVFSDNNGVTVTTRLLHSSGEEREQHLTLPVMQKTPQGIGSAITYARRYAFCACLGIAAEEDDDGNAASGTRAKDAAPKATPAGPSQTERVTDKVKAKAAKTVEKAPAHANGVAGGGPHKGKQLAELTHDQLAETLEHLRSKAAAAAAAGPDWAALNAACIADCEAEQAARDLKAMERDQAKDGKK